MYFIPQPTDPTIPTISYYGSAPSVSGYELSITGNYTFEVSPGYARAFNSDYGISYQGNVAGAPGVIKGDVSTVGPGGCWPVAISEIGLAYNTVFGVYVIANSLGTTSGSLNPNVNVSVVVATGNNFLPPGYDTFRRIGLVCALSASSNNLSPWVQGGTGQERIYSIPQNLILVTGGSATSFTKLDMTANNGIVLPNKNSNVEFICRLQAGTAGDLLTLSDTGVTSTTNALMVSPSADGQLGATFNTLSGTDPTTGNSVIWYFVSSGATAQVGVSGFVDELGADLF